MKDVNDFILDWDVTKPKQGIQQSVEEIKNIFIGLGAANKTKEVKRTSVKRPPRSLERRKRALNKS